MQSRSKYLLKDPLKITTQKINNHLSFCLMEVHVYIHFAFISQGQDQHHFATTLRRLGYVLTSLYLADRIHMHVLFGIHVGSEPSLHKLSNPSFNWHNKSTVVLYCSGMASPIANILYYICAFGSRLAWLLNAVSKRGANKSSGDLLHLQGLIWKKGGKIGP